MRVLAIVALVIGGLIAVLFAVIVVFHYQDLQDYKEASITNQLLMDGVYDPARYFHYDRACVFGPEVFGIGRVAPEYRKMDGPLLPDTLTNWTLVLIDDGNKTYRILYVLDRLVKFGVDRCLPKIILRTRMVDGDLTAFAETEAGQ